MEKKETTWKGKGAGRQRLRNIFVVTFHDAYDTMTTKANRQQLNRTQERRRRAAAIKQKKRKLKTAAAKR